MVIIKITLFLNLEKKKHFPVHILNFDLSTVLFNVKQLTKQTYKVDWNI